MPPSHAALAFRAVEPTEARTSASVHVIEVEEEGDEAARPAARRLHAVLVDAGEARGVSPHLLVEEGGVDVLPKVLARSVAGQLGRFQLLERCDVGGLSDALAQPSNLEIVRKHGRRCTQRLLTRSSRGWACLAV